MPVEILTVGLDEATIETLAKKVASLLSDGNWPTTQSNPPSPETRRTQSAPVQNTDPEGWDKPDSVPASRPDSQPDSAPDSAPADAGPPAVRSPRCNHGEMRYVKAGYSKNGNRPYPAFYGCSAPKGEQQCQSIKVADWEARMASA